MNHPVRLGRGIASGIQRSDPDLIGECESAIYPARKLSFADSVFDESILENPAIEATPGV